jgi:DNA-binding response OmpR family regulator
VAGRNAPQIAYNFQQFFGNCVRLIPTALKTLRANRLGWRVGKSMTSKRLYETAEALVYDPVASNRNASRASLHSIGFRKVDLAASLEILDERLRVRAPDLLLAEVAGSENEVCALVQSLRRGTLGDNPFIVVVVTTWRRDGTIVGQVVNSGADDLIARPVSTTILGERIRALIDRRKGFVITSDYIGPDRRREPRTAGVERIEVPNPLKIRTLEGLAEDEAELRIVEAVRRGKETLNLQKMRRDAVQLCLQWRMLEQRTPGARDFCEILPRIERLAAEMNHRAGLIHQESAREWCDSVAQSIHALVGMGERSEDITDYRPPLSLLGRAALTLGQMFAPDEVEPARLMELDRIMASRHPAPAAA